MKKKDTYIENKIQNTFTAYLIKSLQGVRKDYLIKRNKISIYEEYLEDISNMSGFAFVDCRSCLQPIQEDFDNIENHKLYKAVMCLNESERELVYLHIFEEKTFVKIAQQLNQSESIIKGRYYYAITKIRNRMKGE